MSREERERRWLESRRRGEPTLPLHSELEGLSPDAQARLIGEAAARVVAWQRQQPAPQPVTPTAREILRERRALLAHRVRAEVLDVPQVPARFMATPCPWCGRSCEPEEPGCREHAELERGFLQAAGDGWG